MMASSNSIKLLLARCGPWHNLGWSSAAGDLILSSTTTTRRAFSDDNSGRNSGGGGLSNFKIRRPPGGGRSGGRGPPTGPRSHQMNDTDAPNPAAPLPQRKDLFRQHIVDLFPGDYGDDDDDDEDGDFGSLDEGVEEYDPDDENFFEMEESIAQLHQQQQEWEANKERWMRNSIPPVRVPVIDFMGRSYGRGGRKSAEARVWITPGFGNVTVNRQDFVEYFPRRSDREQVLDPLVATKTAGKFDLQCIVKGGGLTGQAGAIRLGVARALQHWNPEYRPAMKKMGYLTRDARRVERKKIGRVKARKRPQWNRR